MILYVGECLFNEWIFIVNFCISLGSRFALQFFFRLSLLFLITLVEVLTLVEEFVLDLLHDVTWQVYNLSKGRLGRVAGLRRRKHNLVLETERHLCFLPAN